MPNNKAKLNLNTPSSRAAACRLDPAFKGRFESLATELQAHRDHGAKLIDCPQCGYHASVEEQGFAPIYFSHCLLCRTKVRFVRMRCQCGTVSAYDGAQHNKCVSCALPFTYGNVVAQNEPKTCGEESPDEYEGAQAHCHVCRKNQDSVFEFDHQWLCLNCLEEHRPPGTCEECETVQTGDLEDSFETGCMVCAGRLSWD
jgi:hypothetical protein